MHNKNSNTQGMWLVIFGTALKGKEFASSGSKFFPLREFLILKRDIIVENHCLIQWSSFDVQNFFSISATPLVYQWKRFHSFYINMEQKDLPQLFCWDEEHSIGSRLLGTFTQQLYTIIWVRFKLSFLATFSNLQENIDKIMNYTSTL